MSYRLWFAFRVYGAVMMKLINRLVVIGVGLIGGSLAKALREAHAVGEIIGYGRDADQLQLAVDLGVIDQFELNLPTAVKTADVVVVATPVGSMGDIFAQLKGCISEQTIYTLFGAAHIGDDSLF